LESQQYHKLSIEAEILRKKPEIIEFRASKEFYLSQKDLANSRKENIQYLSSAV